MASRPTRSRVFLRPLEASDYESLRRIELSTKFAARWRLTDHPPPEEYSRSLWEGVQAQFLAFDSGVGVCLGMFTVYALDSHNRVCKFAAARFVDDASARILFLIAFHDAIRRMFETYDLRKAYMDVPEFNFSAVESFVSRDLFKREGTLLKFRYFAGRYWDQEILSMDRETVTKMASFIDGLGLN